MTASVLGVAGNVEVDSGGVLGVQWAVFQGAFQELLIKRRNVSDGDPLVESNATNLFFPGENR